MNYGLVYGSAQHELNVGQGIIVCQQIQRRVIRGGSGYLGSRPIHAEYRPVREAQFHKFSICLKLEAS